MSSEKLKDIIDNFSPDKFIGFFRDKNRAFSPHQETVGYYDDENFKNGLRLGEIEFTDGRLIVYAFQAEQSLSERSGKKAQYEKGKKILKETQSEPDAGIFIFYDQNGNFRFSFIYPETIGNRRQWSSFRRFTYFVSREFKNKTFLSRIGDNEFSSINKIQDAFSVEKVTKEFYLEYRNLFENLVKNLSSNDTFLNEAYKNDINTDNFAKKLLGQIVFIYFIQKKGWMGVPAGQNWGDGDKNFLINQFEESKRKGANFFNDYLEPLFYETLNNPRRNSADPSFSKDFNSRIPFLNGGLFEAEYDWKNNSIYLDNNIFEAIFDVFERFNFTVEEESPDDKEIAVDPEMLGKVFENLLQEDSRKGTGTYYTPREIVYYMCQESLINYLDANSKLGKEKIEKCVRSLKEDDKLISNKEAVEVDNLLETIKICDPACGSGAFLVGMLNEIVRLRLLLRILFADRFPKKSEYQLKKDTIHNCIYGVDIDPGAIEIAKLRLWLTLVVDYEIRDIEPLPNLDYRLMCGNSLLEEFGGAILYDEDDEKKQLGLFNDPKKQGKISELKKKVGEYFDIHDDEEKRSKRKEINDIKDWLIKTALETRKEELIGSIKSEEAKINMFNKKWREKHFPEKGTKSITWAKINEVLGCYHDPKKAKPFFIWKLEFIDVFEDKGGFDAVIANPPYIRQEKIKDKPLLKKYEVYNSRADIYAYFYEKSWSILKVGGFSCIISSNKWMRAKYGEELREFLKSKSSIVDIIDFGGHKVFESATVDTNIILFQKLKLADTTSGATAVTSNTINALNIKSDFNKEYDLCDYFKKNGFEIKRASLCQDCFTFGSAAIMNLKAKIEKIGTPLKGWDMNIYYGIKTGLNEAFIINTAKREEILNFCETEEERKQTEKIIKPILKGKDVVKYAYKWADKWVIVAKYESHIYIESEYPAIFKYLKNFEKELKNRGQCKYSRSGKKIGQHHWLELDNNPKDTYLAEFEKEKIVWPEIVRGPSFTFDDTGIYCEKTTFIMTGENLKYLLGLLNSKPVSFFFKNYYAGGGLGKDGYMNQKAFLQNIPIPKISIEHQKPFVEIVDKILRTKAKNQNVDTAELERQIDELVYKLYNLTQDEIEIIQEG